MQSVHFAFTFESKEKATDYVNHLIISGSYLHATLRSVGTWKLR
jgi:hypothetical protein